MSKDLIYALDQIEAAPRGKARIEVLRTLDCPELRKLLNYTNSSNITFGVKQLTVQENAVFNQWWLNTVKFSNQQWWANLEYLLDKLAIRQITGGTAQTEIANFLSQCTPNQQKWTERIIKQDLRLNISTSSINEALPGTITKFALPLAKPFKDLKSLNGTWSLQPKMDGGRFVSYLRFKDGQLRSVNLLSRTGKEWGSSFDPIRRSLEQIGRQIQVKTCFDIVLDGEVVVFKNDRMDFQAIQRLFHAVDGRTPEGDMRYVLFDCASIHEYENPKTPYENRLYDLEQVIGPLLKDIDNIKIVQHKTIVNPKKENLDHLAEDYVTRMGCDGAIIRRLDRPPTNKKSSDITKVKPFEDGEAIIIDKVEGKGWLEGSLGALHCQMWVKGKATGPKFEIGTGEGLTKEIRQELWNDPKLIGKLVSFKYQRLSEDGVPILNTFRAIRHNDDIGQ